MKKRKLIVDDQKLIRSDTMRAQLRRSADLVIPLELAPPTKRLMEWKAIGGVDKLLTLPGKHIRPAALRQVGYIDLVFRIKCSQTQIQSKLANYKIKTIFIHSFIYLIYQQVTCLKKAHYKHTAKRAGQRGSALIVAHDKNGNKSNYTCSVYIFETSTP